MFPRQAQGPPGLQSVPRLCSTSPSPSDPMFDRRQQPHQASPGGARGLRTQAPNSRDLSLSSPPQLPAQPVFRCRVFQSACGIFLGSVLVPAIQLQRHHPPQDSPQSSPIYGGGCEAAENRVPVSYHSRIHSGLHIVQTQPSLNHSLGESHEQHLG